MFRNHNENVINAYLELVTFSRTSKQLYLLIVYIDNKKRMHNDVSFYLHNN